MHHPELGFVIIEIEPKPRKIKVRAIPNTKLQYFRVEPLRRLEIARGLLHHPKVLFLDEPTLGLDPQTRNQMWAYLQEMNKNEGTTVFFTTHYMEEADRNAQRIAIIDHGKIVAMGTPAEVKESQNAATLEDAREKLEAWRSDYNELRPHSAIGDKPPSLVHFRPAAPSSARREEAENFGQKRSSDG